MPQEDTDNIKKAIAAIDARKESLKPFRKSSHNKYVKSPIVPGGDTGMRQQGNIKNYPSSRKYESMKQGIKNECNMLGEDIVIMQFGSTFDIVDENAEYFHKEFDFKYNPVTVNFFSTGFSVHSIDKYKKKLLKRNINFCIVEEVFKERGKTIIREVTYSSSGGLSKGKKFFGGIKD